MNGLRRWAHAWLLGVALVLSACSSLPRVDRAAIASEAIEVSNATQSGFRLMPLGSFSFDTRLQLIRRAEATLDVQYYHLADDASGRWLLRALRDAAGRGVRVRLLLDDLYTGGRSDELLLGLAAHPNVQVRLFNPFTAARAHGLLGRFLAAPHEWRRINHRMHNKLLVADGAMAVTGGRNIADDYFQRGAQHHGVLRAEGGRRLPDGARRHLQHRQAQRNVGPQHPQAHHVATPPGQPGDPDVGDRRHADINPHHDQTDRLG